jgi:biotin synthase
MKSHDFYDNLVEQSLRGDFFPIQTCEDILHADSVELLPLLEAAFTVRKKFWGRSVKIHILNNVQNGLCDQDCQYCAQSRQSQVPIETYPMKSDADIMTEAQKAYEKGAFRYCMVFSGKGISDKRIQHIARLVKEIKQRYPIEVCVSPGIITHEQAKVLKAAGLNRLNHNINTSEALYPRICSTHSYQDRMATLKAAKAVELQICSGVIIGMGEATDDIITMAATLRELQVESIPVNFFMPMKGLPLAHQQALSPTYCLRVLCLFRFLNPKSEIRVAAGREYYLRHMEVMAFYPANSLFLQGYLNAKGANRLKTLQMLKDAHFTIESDKELDDLIQTEIRLHGHECDDDTYERLVIKNKDDLGVSQPSREHVE